MYEKDDAGSRRRGRDEWDEEYDRGKVGVVIRVLRLRGVFTFLVSPQTKKLKKHHDRESHWKKNLFQEHYQTHKSVSICTVQILLVFL